MMIENINCIVDIVPEGRFVIVELPFDVRKEFGIPKGNIYANCVINNVAFRTRILSRGSHIYFFHITKEMRKKIGFTGQVMTGIELNISPDIIDAEKADNSNVIKPLLLDSQINVLEAISKRQSVRRFSGEKLSESQINTILNAGFCAPSAQNKRPYHFIVVKDKDIRKKIADTSTYAKMLEHADIGIVVCGDKLKQGTTELLIEDCSAAVQNMLLAIHGLELGGVWCGIVKNTDWYRLLIQELQLPDKIIPIALLAVGYPEEEPRIRERFEADKIHYETW